MRGRERGQGTDTATVTMLVLALILFGLAYRRGDGSHIAGLRSAGQTLWSILPLLLASFTVAGLVQVLVPRELIAGWLGAESGLRGILIASAAGAVTPGGPFVSFPIVASLYQAGAGMGTVVAFITAWSLWAVARLPMEVALIGPCG